MARCSSRSRAKKVAARFQRRRKIVIASERNTAAADFHGSLDENNTDPFNSPCASVVLRENSRLLLFFGFFREFRETRHARNTLTPQCLGAGPVRNRLETGMNGRVETGRQRNDPSGRSTVPRSSAACSRLPHASQQTCSTVTSPPRLSIDFRRPQGTRLRVSQCLSLPLPCRFTRPFNFRFPRKVPL